MRKALIQTVFAWEYALIGPDDWAADSAVISNLRDDSSTGVCQIFGKTAISALNFAIEKGWRSGETYDPSNEEHIEEVWSKLHDDESYCIEVAALVLLWGAESELNLDSDYLNYNDEEIQRVITRYNGPETVDGVPNEPALAYGERNFGTYQIFEKYNELSRSN